MRPETIAELQAAVCSAPRVSARGGGTKNALASGAADVRVIDMTGLAGILEYEPGEYTFTARAGTRIAEISATLAEHGQFLPFDPPFAAAGATLGGTVAAGLSGPGRYRYGGVRDFILGVRYVDGEGRLLKAGGKVVKNAAGFDIPKLMVGSLGELGVLAELTFKVFPAPQAYATVRFDFGRLDDGLAALARLTGSQMDLHALDLLRADEGVGLYVRLSGLVAALPARVERLRGLLDCADCARLDDEGAFWREATEFAWVPAGMTLVKVPLTPQRIPALDAALAVQDSRTVRRYSAGGQVAWLAVEGDMTPLDSVLAGLGLPGLVVKTFEVSSTAQTFEVWKQPKATATSRVLRLGQWPGAPFEERIRAAFDPVGRFIRNADDADQMD